MFLEIIQVKFTLNLNIAVLKIFQEIKFRTVKKFYQKLLTEILLFLDVDLNKIEFVRGRSYQLEPKYTFDVYKLMAVTKFSNAKHAGAEVVKQDTDPQINSLVYPMLQALDEVYLNVDAQLGGVDQRKIFMYARDFLPKIGYKKKRIHLMTSLVSALRSVPKTECENKMSSSNVEGKVDILDGKKIIKRKINKTHCLPGNIEDNSLLELLKMVIFPLLDHKNKKFVINRKEENGGTLIFDNFENVEAIFKNENLHCADLKMGIADTLIELFEPIREKFADVESQKLLRTAYK